MHPIFIKFLYALLKFYMHNPENIVELKKN